MRRLGRAGRDLVVWPATWRVRQWAMALAVAATTVFAYVEKAPIQARVQGGPGGALHDVAVLVDACGDGRTVTALGLVALALGRWTRRPALVEAALALGVAGLWCWVLTRAGQLVLAERRPSEGGAMRLFAPGGHGVSGHAAAAALLFFPVRDVVARDATPRGRAFASAALLAWAALVGWSRVWLGMHFVWNVVLGLAIGLATGFVATRPRRP